MRLDVFHVLGDFRADTVNTKPVELPGVARIILIPLVTGVAGIALGFFREHRVRK